MYLESKKREKERECMMEIFEQITTKNFSELTKDTKTPQTQGAQRENLKATREKDTLFTHEQC